MTTPRRKRFEATDQRRKTASANSTSFRSASFLMARSRASALDASLPPRGDLSDESDGLTMVVAARVLVQAVEDRGGRVYRLDYPLLSEPAKCEAYAAV
jgi:hypothetical protein